MGSGRHLGVTRDEAVEGFTRALEGIARIRGRGLDLNGLIRQLMPWQVEVMHLYVRAVASGLVPRWIDPPGLDADDTTFLHAWAALADVLPRLFPGQVVAIMRRAATVKRLPGKRYKVQMHHEDVPLLVDHAESMVSFMLLRSKAGQLTPRLTIDLAHDVVTLDGQAYPVTENQARAVRQLLDARGGFVSGKQFKQSVGSGERPDRWINTMPPPLLKIIESKTGAGYRLKIAVE